MKPSGHGEPASFASFGGGILNDGGTVTLRNGTTVCENAPNNCAGTITGNGCAVS